MGNQWPSTFRVEKEPQYTACCYRQEMSTQYMYNESSADNSLE